MKQKIIYYIKYINLPRVVCEHLFGKEHTHSHRMMVGIVVMAIGVTTSKLFVEYHILHMVCDGIGYMIHGAGTIPFIEYLANSINGTKDDNT